MLVALGAFFARIKEYQFEEVVAANATGERLLIIDGMVLDVKRWLPEHPGGSKIIPKQVCAWLSAALRRLRDRQCAC